MDLLTPAQTWANADPAEPHASQMTLAQHAAMAVTVVGPLLGLLAAIILLWRRFPGGRGIGWPEVIAMLVTYALAGFGVTIGYHRLLTHRAFQTSRPMKLLLAVLGSSACQGMAIKWCATHRRHHQRADQEGDPHSPHLHGHGIAAFWQGLWHAHLGWVFQADRPALARSVPDLVADPALLFIDRFYFAWVLLGILLPGLVLGLNAHSWPAFFSGIIWGGLVRICLMQHVTWSINSVCHVWGARPFRSSDCSTNNFPIAIVSLGEGWHNNHHAFPTSARHGLKWWQFDASWVVISTMKRLGLIWEVRTPTTKELQLKAITA